MKEATQLLEQALRALNTSPNFTYFGRYDTSYDLAADIGRYLKSLPLTQPFTPKMLLDIMSTAFEGGIDYWACIGKYTVDNDPEFDINDYPEYCWVPLVPGNKLTLIEAVDFDEEPESWEVTLDEIKLALTKVALEYPDVYERLLKGDYDAADADVLLQIAAIGQITYG